MRPRGRGARAGLVLAAALLVGAAAGVALGMGTPAGPPATAGSTVHKPAPVPVTVRLQAGVSASVHTMVVAGRTRRYLVVAPARGSTAGLPLLVVLHGSHVGPRLEEVRTDFWPLARHRRALVVYPAGYKKSWNAGQGCCGAANAHHIRDVAFVDALVRAVEGRYRTDRGRTYLVGYSNGGKLAQEIACERRDPFTAVASYGGVPLVPCGHGPPQSVLFADATADPLVPYTGGPAWHNGALLPSVTSAVATWVARDRCRWTAHVRRLAGGAVTVTTWPACRQGDQVRLVTYRGGSHLWPGSTPGAHVPYAVPSPVPVQSLMWRFFAGRVR